MEDSVSISTKKQSNNKSKAPEIIQFNNFVAEIFLNQFINKKMGILMLHEIHTMILKPVLI